MSFDGKTILITGGMGGIGQACARRFSLSGGNVVLVDRDVSQADLTLAELNQARAGTAVAVACDVSVEGDVKMACDFAEARFGNLDIIVNVAGMMIYKPIEDLTQADWLTLLSVNFVGAALFTTEAFRRMKKGGAIVNISSIHALQTSPLVGPYAAAKGALNAFTRAASIEGEPKGIRVNAVMPGAIDTPMLWASPNIRSGIETLEPRDIGKPENVADTVAFLAGPEAAFITGACLNVDGGRLAKL